MCRNRKLWEQIAEANDSVVASFAEGFEQTTDAGFANYLVHAKASIAEVIKRLKQAECRRSIRNQDLVPSKPMPRKSAGMPGGFIKYLKASDFKHRGSSNERRDSGIRGSGNRGLGDSGIRGFGDSRIQG